MASENDKMKINASITLVLVMTAAVAGLEYFARRHGYVARTTRDFLTDLLPS